MGCVRVVNFSPVPAACKNASSTIFISLSLVCVWGRIRMCVGSCQENDKKRERESKREEEEKKKKQ